MISTLVPDSKGRNYSCLCCDGNNYNKMVFPRFFYVVFENNRVIVLKILHMMQTRCHPEEGTFQTILPPVSEQSTQ